MSQHKIKKVNSIAINAEPGVYNLKGKIVTHTGLETIVEQGQAAMTDINKFL